MAEAIKGLNIKLGLDTTELEASIKSLNSDLKEQQKDLAAINKNLRYDPSNVELWSQKQDKLNSILDSTKRKLEEQRRQLELAKEGLKLGTVSEGEFRKMQRSVQYTEAEVSRLNKELKETGDKISALSRIDVGKLSSIGSSMTKFITAPAIAAATALGTLAVKTGETVDEMSDTAGQLGVGLEALQKWEYATKQLGSDTEYLEKAFMKVNTLLGDIADGEDVSEELAKIGLTMDDLAGMDAEQAFSKIRNAISEVGDSATRTALANEFFGEKIGTALAPVLSASEEELSSWAKEAEEVGIVSEEDAEALGALGDQINALQQSFLTLRVELSVAVLPALTRLIDFLKETAIPALKGMVGRWEALSSSSKKAAASIAATLIAIGPILAAAAKAIGLAVKLKEAVGALGGAANALGAIAKAGPWAAIIAIVAALLLQNEKFRELLKEIFEVLQKLVSKVVELIGRIVEGLKPILDALMDVINEVIDVLVDIIGEVLDALMVVLDEVVKLLESLIEPIGEILRMLTEILVPITRLISKILQAVVKVLKAIIELVVEVIDTLVELLDGVLSIVIEVIGVIVDILGVVIDLVVGLLDVLVDILVPVLEIIMALLEPIIGFIRGIIEVVATLFEALDPLLNALLSPIMDVLGVIFTVIEGLSPILVTIGEVIKAVILPVLNVLFEILKPILTLLNGIIEAVQWIIDHTVGWIVDLIGNMFGGGDFSASNSVSTANNSYTNTDNSTTTNNVTINTSGDVDIDSINEALGGAY